jgi:hypothetical protein
MRLSGGSATVTAGHSVELFVHAKDSPRDAAAENGDAHHHDSNAQTRAHHKQGRR